MNKFVKNRKLAQNYEKRLVLKSFICLIYLIVITILIVCVYQLYNQKKEIVPLNRATSVDDYSYITISKMSEKFAYYERANKQIHFVIEKEETGLWHTYLIAIRPDDYQKYKAIIDYTYERTTEIPESIKVYGYPVVIDDDLKKLAIKNIVNFVPAENEVVINEENFNTYLTNSYLDTTILEKDNFSYTLCLVLIILVIVIILFFGTLFDKGKFLNIAYDKIDNSYHNDKKMFSVHK